MLTETVADAGDDGSTGYLLGVLTIIRRLRRRPDAATRHAPVNDPNVSRAGMATRGMRPGSTRHRPSEAEDRLAALLGVEVYDPTERRI